MDALPPQRLQCVVNIGERHPPIVEEISEHRLVGELIGRYLFVVQQCVQKLVIYGGRGVDDLEAAIGHTQGRFCRGAVGLRVLGIGMQGCEAAVLGYPGSR